MKPEDDMAVQAQEQARTSEARTSEASTARWLLRIGDLSSVTGLWVPSSTKSTNLVTFTSNANLTPTSYAKDRVDNYIGANP